MSRNVWCFLGLLLLWAFGVSDAVDADCNSRKDLAPGVAYYISSPNYPDSYPASKSCQWSAVSNTSLVLTCDEVNIASTENCGGDSLTVYTSRDSSPYTFCSSRSFTVESEGTEMFVTLTTASNTEGGTFRCQVEATGDSTATIETNCDCGETNQPQNTRIVGGVQTAVNEFPMMAGLVNVATKSVFCGGTIISVKHVLTAAHCLILTASQMGVLVGDHDISTGTDTSTSQLLKVSGFVRHPSFTSTEYGYDIGIVTTATTITFSSGVGLACLPFRRYQYSFAGLSVTELGWGLTEFAGATSDTLQKVSLNVVDYSTCSAYFSTLTTSQMCTYADGKDSCQYDSGGPVLWYNPSTGRYVLVGIISYGRYCATDEPGVSTRVGAYLDWIVSNTFGSLLCILE